AAPLFLEQAGGSPAHEEASMKMHCDHRGPFFLRHLVEDDIANDPGIVDDDIELAEAVACLLDNVMRRLPVRNGIGDDDGPSAESLNLGEGLLRGQCGAAVPSERHADIIDDDRC